MLKIVKKVSKELKPKEVSTQVLSPNVQKKVKKVPTTFVYEVRSQNAMKRKSTKFERAIAPKTKNNMLLTLPDSDHDKWISPPWDRLTCNWSYKLNRSGSACSLRIWWTMYHYLLFIMYMYWHGEFQHETSSVTRSADAKSRKVPSKKHWTLAVKFYRLYFLFLNISYLN